MATRQHAPGPTADSELPLTSGCSSKSAASALSAPVSARGEQSTRRVCPTHSTLEVQCGCFSIIRPSEITR